MHRLKAYLRAFVWQTGFGYLAVWALTYWALKSGAHVFGSASACHPDDGKVLFYWACSGANPLAVLAALVNFALTVTVWAPVYVAAATVTPVAVPLALSIIGFHVLGLPAAMFVLVRLMVTLCDSLRPALRRRRAPVLGLAVVPSEPVFVDTAAAPRPEPARPVSPQRRPPIKPRAEFGLRGRVRR